MKRKYEVECIAPVGDRCGEGPVWHASEQALYWTDINRFLIHVEHERPSIHLLIGLSGCLLLSVVSLQNVISCTQ
jgi:hypothetical protein